MQQIQKNIEEVCGITAEEFQKIIFAKWQKEPHASVTTINYTFDLASMPSALKKDLNEQFTKATVSSLNVVARKYVEDIFKLWVPACGNNIQFNYLERLGAEQPGIVLVACEALVTKEAHVSGMAYLELFGPYFHQALVCLPSTPSTPFQLKTYVHEIGHALGLDHPHEVESIKQRLMTTEQGLGCSVMAYTHELQSPINNCTTPEYCGDQNYAIYPGLMDKEACSALYQFPSFSMTHYFNVFFKGLLSGSLENMLSSYLSNLEGINLTKDVSDIISLTVGLLVRYSMQEPHAVVSNGLVLGELLAQLNEHESAQLFKLLKIISNMSGIFFSLYTLYGDEQAMNKSFYLLTFLIANVWGVKYGASLGEELADWTNTLISSLPPLLNSGANTVSKIVSRVTEVINPIRHSFFGKTNVTHDKYDNKKSTMDFASIIQYP